MNSPAQKIDEIFWEASQLASAKEQAAYLDRVCADTPGVRREVEKLLRAQPKAEQFLEQAAVAQPAATLDDPIEESPGTVIGHYKLLEQIGEGGFGVVFMAEQTEPVKRKVALKILKPGMDTKQVIARFEAERQALALMEHPHIARVFDAGATELGRPYFVMELVRGVPITKYCDDTKLTPRERLVLFADVCHAVQHAHQKGIIHRDIKPNNVLVTMHDDKAVVKIIDFGIAKAMSGQLTDKTLFTGFAQMIGTPLYMSPEQAQMSGLDVDTRSDIYSLGVLLYELLTGATPFDDETLKKADYDEMRRIIREEEPPKPSARVSTMKADARATVSDRRQVDPRKLGQSYRGELDWIVMKALEKDRNRRYETAGEFAADVHRFLAGEAVQACPPSWLYKMRKFVGRNRGAVLAGGLVILALVVGIAGTTWGLIHAESARKSEAEQRELAQQRFADAEEQRRLAEEHSASLRRRLYAADVRRAFKLWQSAEIDEMALLLAEYEPQSGQEDLRGFEWYYLRDLARSKPKHLFTYQGHRDTPFQNVYGAAISPDGRTAASAGEDSTVRLWDTESGELLRTFSGHRKDANFVSFSPDGNLLASSGEEGKVWLWNLETGAGQLLSPAHKGEVYSVYFSPDGKRLVSAGQHGVIRIWDVTEKNLELELTGHNGAIAHVRFSPDGKRLASVGKQDGCLKVWNLSDGPQSFTRMPSIALFCVAFSPTDPIFATAGADGIVQLWQADTGKLLRTLGGHHIGSVKFVNFSPDGKTLCSAGDDGRIVFWSIPWGSLRYRFKPQPNITIWCLRFSPDGSNVLTAGRDGTVRIWKRPTRLLPNWAATRGFAAQEIAFSPYGRRLAMVASDGRLALGEVASRQPLELLPVQAAPDARIDFSPDGEWLAFSAPGGAVKQWHVEERREELVFAELSENKEEHPSPGESWPAYFPDGRLIALSGNGILRSRRPGGKSMTKGKIWGSRRPWPRLFAVAPDSRKFIACESLGSLRMWDLESNGWCSNNLGGHYPHCVAFSPDGRTLALGDNAITLLDAATGKVKTKLVGHRHNVNTVAFSPDGKTLASGSSNGTVRLWHTPTGLELFTLETRPNRQIQSLAFSPDGQVLAVAGDPHDDGSTVSLHYASRN